MSNRNPVSDLQSILGENEFGFAVSSLPIRQTVQLLKTVLSNFSSSQAAPFENPPRVQPTQFGMINEVLVWEPGNGKGQTVWINDEAAMGTGSEYIIKPMARKRPDAIFASASLHDLGTETPRGGASFTLGMQGAERMVASLNAENGWEFFQEGAPAWFESVHIYESEEAKMRVTAPLVIQYLLELGFDVCAREFWSTKVPGVLLQRIRPNVAQFGD